MHSQPAGDHYAPGLTQREAGGPLLCPARGDLLPISALRAATFCQIVNMAGREAPSVTKAEAQ